MQCKLPSLDNMHYSHSLVIPGDVVQVKCDYGYARTGPGIIACQEDETFNVTTFPSCKCELFHFRKVEFTMIYLLIGYFPMGFDVIPFLIVFNHYKRKTCSY